MKWERGARERERGLYSSAGSAASDGFAKMGRGRVNAPYMAERTSPRVVTMILR